MRRAVCRLPVACGWGGHAGPLAARQSRHSLAWCAPSQQFWCGVVSARSWVCFVWRCLCPRLRAWLQLDWWRVALPPLRVCLCVPACVPWPLGRVPPSTLLHTPLNQALRSFVHRLLCGHGAPRPPPLPRERTRRRRCKQHARMCAWSAAESSRVCRQALRLAAGAWPGGLLW
jgi:hypothetical protein